MLLGILGFRSKNVSKCIEYYIKQLDRLKNKRHRDVFIVLNVPMNNKVFDINLYFEDR